MLVFSVLDQKHLQGSVTILFGQTCRTLYKSLVLGLSFTL